MAKRLGKITAAMRLGWDSTVSSAQRGRTYSPSQALKGCEVWLWVGLNSDPGWTKAVTSSVWSPPWASRDSRSTLTVARYSGGKELERCREWPRNLTLGTHTQAVGYSTCLVRKC